MTNHPDPLDPSVGEPLQAEAVHPAPRGGLSAAAIGAYASPPPAPPNLPPIIIQQTGGGLWKILAWIGWTGLLLCVPILIGMRVAYHEYFNTTDGLQEKYHSLSKFATKKIAIIRVEGPIMSGEGYVRQQIDRIREDSNVVGIVLRVDSPGGTVSGSDYIYHHLTKLRQDLDIPLVVSMGSLAASGGYYVAMAVGDQEDAVFAEPTTTTGSIGVIFPHYDISGLLETYNVRDDSIVSHPRKQIASMTRQISPEDRAILQSYVDQSFQRFREIVLSGRPKFRDQPEALDALATGEIFTAVTAEANGLVDKIGFLEEAIDRTLTLAGMEADQVRVIQYDRPLGLFDVLQVQGPSGVEQMLPGRVALDLESRLLDLSVPRPFYMYTTLPCLTRSK